MSTQFFERQDNARSNTVYLVVLFAVAVVALVAVNSGVAWYVGDLLRQRFEQQGGAPEKSISPASIAFVAGVATVGVILIGTMFQVYVLRIGGGAGVAESLGGRQLLGETQDADERKLLNIVEEMAIASGTPVPPVFVMEEKSINAFAAGYLPGDAVLGVTRGAIDSLNRAEMQGVIGHEFSHILNGDMRMNIRMIGVLHGILLIGIIGRTLADIGRVLSISEGGRSKDRDSSSSSGTMIFMVGVFLVIVGWIGTFIGGLIKAAVSRQREYLADASAVQFTRNAAGLADALKRIAAVSNHGMITHANASVASHMYFAQGVYEGFTGLLATHPPIERRILALEPNWDGKLPITRGGKYPDNIEVGLHKPSTVRVGAPTSAISNLAGDTTSPAQAANYVASSDQAQIPVPAVMAASEQIGAPVLAHRQYAAALLKHIDKQLIDASRDPYSARALVIALLLGDSEAVQQTQFQLIEEAFEPHFVYLTRKLGMIALDMPEAAKLPLVDLAMPMLRRMSAPQYEEFETSFKDLCHADSNISIFEWTLAQVIHRHLRRQYVPVEPTGNRTKKLQGLEQELSLLFSILANIGNEKGEVDKAFEEATKRFPNLDIHWISPKQHSLDRLEEVLKRLASLYPKIRGEIVDACAAIVCSDRIVRVREAELLRGISDLLDCPMPPLVGKIETYA